MSHTLQRFERLPVQDLLNHPFDHIACEDIPQLAISNTLVGQVLFLLGHPEGTYRFRGFYGSWGMRIVDITLRYDLRIPVMVVEEILD